MFYRFMNDGNIKWRKLLYAMNLQLRMAEGQVIDINNGCLCVLREFAA